ncbi:hypothetical protein [Aquipuribacter nitratireducens]|uniref:DUF2470 domain-containing protein n=1 Tax=Aquipuribacter nitratireducens TaxID=650104 RepID=A0ABW0GQ20_9MICO
MTAYRPADRVRSALAAAGSVHVSWAAGSATLDGPVCVAEDGDVVLAADGPLGALGPLPGREASSGTGDVVLRVTDLAPLALRGRVRGSAELVTRVTAVDGTARHGLRLRPHAVRWTSVPRPGQRRRPTVDVDPADYRAARPDPLAAEEADLLLGLAAAPGAVAALAAHLPACVAVSPERVPVPVRLDRHGVVLRVEGAGRSVDARLAFRHDAATPALAWAALDDLLARV